MIALLKKYWITISLSIIILLLCFLNFNDLPIDQEPMTNFDKLVHLLMFLGLSGAVFFDHTRYLKRQIKSVPLLLVSFLFPVVFSGLIEIMQDFTTYRSGDWEDFLFDGIGAFVGLMICFGINRKLKWGM